MITIALIVLTRLNMDDQVWLIYPISIELSIEIFVALQLAFLILYTCCL
jgi:hypothetical protein